MRILKSYPLLKLLNSYPVNSSKALSHTSIPFKPIHPWFITGFLDAESSFMIFINKNHKYKTGWTVKSGFSINLHKKDKALLEKCIKNYFGVGSIYEHSKDMFIYQVQSIKDLPAIINHFDKYPLITQKRGDFELFKQAVKLIQVKEHLTEQGLHKILAIKS